MILHGPFNLTRTTFVSCSTAAQSSLYFAAIYFEGTLYREILSNLCLNRPILIYICIKIVLASVRLLADSSGIRIIVVLSLCYSFVKLDLCQKCTNFKSGGNAVKWEEPLWRVVALQRFCALAPLVLCCTCIPPPALDLFSSKHLPCKSK